MSCHVKGNPVPGWLAKICQPIRDRISLVMTWHQRHLSIRVLGPFPGRKWIIVHSGENTVATVMKLFLTLSSIFHESVERNWTNEFLVECDCARQFIQGGRLWLLKICRGQSNRNLTRTRLNNEHSSIQVILTLSWNIKLNAESSQNIYSRILPVIVNNPLSSFVNIFILSDIRKFIFKSAMI